MTTKEVAALAALAQKAIRITIEYWVWETNKKYRQRFFDQLSQIYTIRHQLIQYSYWRYQWWTCPELNIDPCKHQLKTLALRLLSFSSPNCVGICQVCHQHILFMTKVGDSVITECQSSSCGAFGEFCFFGLFD